MPVAARIAPKARHRRAGPSHLSARGAAGGPAALVRARIACVLALAAFAANPAHAGGPPRLDLPIDCTIGETCWIQNYVDDDPGPGARDYRCHALTYDGHKGTDFALPSRAAMAKGITVAAAAPGRVLALRDGMEDGTFASDPAAIEGRECGNGVVIDHGDGWQTQYCHMKKGSLRVRRGEQVAAGAALGLVGLSGKTEFPHLHLSVRHQGNVVDPFDPQASAACALPPPDTLWRDHPPAYLPGGMIAAGFAAALPDYDAIKAGSAAATTLPADAGALVLWGFAFGARPGDVIHLEIEGPGGFHHEFRAPIKKDTAQLYRASGKRRGAAGWTEGTYRGTVTLERAGRAVSRRSTTVAIAG